MKNKLIVLSGAVMGFAPMVALAQGVTGGNPQVCNATNSIASLGDVICKISNLLSAIIPVLVILGVIFFVWGVVQFVIANDEEAKVKGKNRIIYGVIGLAVIVGVWGLVRILNQTFGVGNVENINYPTVPY